MISKSRFKKKQGCRQIFEFRKVSARKKKVVLEFLFFFFGGEVMRSGRRRRRRRSVVVVAAADTTPINRIIYSSNHLERKFF